MRGVIDNPSASLEERIWDAYQSAAGVAVQMADAGDRPRGARLFSATMGVLELTDSWRADMEPMARAVVRITGAPEAINAPYLMTPDEEEAYGRMAVLCIRHLAERSGRERAAVAWRTIFSDTPPWEMTPAEFAAISRPEVRH